MKNLVACTLGLLGLIVAAPALAGDTHASLGAGQGIIVGGAAASEECAGTLIGGWDGSAEDGYAWQYGGVTVGYGEFAECFNGTYDLNAIRLYLTTLPGQQGTQTMDVFVWSDAGGVPGNVIGAAFGVTPGAIAFWPAVSIHDVAVSPSVPLSGSWWAGYRGNWDGLLAAWYVAADRNGPGGCPMAHIAPGLGYPSGWQDVSVVWGETASLGIRACVSIPAPRADCAPSAPECCLPGPGFTDPTYAPFLGATVAMTTHYGFSGTDPALRITDLTLPPSGYCSPRYTLPAWDRNHLGTVFGLTSDKFGNLYVTHTSCYEDDQLGPATKGGAIYRIDAVTGAVSLFAQLPNYKDVGVYAGQNWPGLGAITYDCIANQFFVSNLEDGRIWCLRSGNALNASPATVQSNPFDPWTPDTGPTIVPPPANSPSAGWAPLGERIWAVEYHNNRVYFSRWSQNSGEVPGAGPNAIYSVALSGGGVIDPASLQLEITLPVIDVNRPYSNPVSDITFSVAGYMMLAERGIWQKTNTAPHNARALEYFCSGGRWVSTTNAPVNHAGFDVGDPSYVPSCAGGAAYDDNAAWTGSGMAGRTWATGDALVNTSVYGLQGFPPIGGNGTNSVPIDLNCVFGGQDKSKTGEVDIPCRRGALEGRKYIDYDGDCVKDSGEPYAQGWTIRATGSSGYTTTAVTDAQGKYRFASLPAGTYNVCEVTQPGYIVLCPTGGCAVATVIATQTTAGPDFANLPCQSYTVPPHRCTAGWWRFDECSGATTKDATGLSNGTLVGAPVWTPTWFGCGLAFPTAGSYVSVPSSSAIDVTTGSFSLGLWFRSTNSSTSVRTILDKRQVSPLQGYSLFIDQGKLGLQLASGGTWTNYWVSTSPTLTTGAAHWLGVCVSRDPASPSSNTIRFYVDGVQVASWSGAAVNPGTLTNSHPLWMGEQSKAPGTALDATIDEVTFYNCCVEGSYFQQIANSGDSGFSNFTCRLPGTLTTGGNTVTSTLTICNYSSQTCTYNWTLAGLPSGGGCAVAGPTLFSPSAGTETVLPGQCKDVTVTVTLPPGVSWWDFACYQATVYNRTLGGCCQSTGRVRSAFVFVDPMPPWGLPWATPFVIDGGITGPDTLDTPLHYILSARPLEGGESAILLNGLPPGTPVEGDLYLPAGERVSLEVEVTYPDYRPLDPHDIVVSANVGPGGQMIEIGVIPVACIPFSGGPSGTGDAGNDLTPARVPLHIVQNPFRERATLRFSLESSHSVEISIFDVGGRLVRELQKGPLAAGSHEFGWDAHDARGTRVESGVYFARIRIDREAESSKLILLK